MTVEEKVEELIYSVSNFVTMESMIKPCAIDRVEEIIDLDVVWYDPQLVIDYPNTYSAEQTIEFWTEVRNKLKK